MKRLTALMLAIAMTLYQNTVSLRAASIFDPARNSQYCSTSIPKYPGTLPKKLDQDFSDYQAIYGSDIAVYLDAYAEYILALTAASTISKNASASLKREIVKNARRKLLDYDPLVSVPPIFFAILVMTPITIAYALHQSEYTQEEKKSVEGWISYHISHILKNEFFASQQSDNKKYFYGVWLAAFGKATGDTSYIDRAKQIYITAIDNQRDDGSLLDDSQRGGCALQYTNQAVSSLVALAEILSYKSNEDFYTYNKNGKSLNNIIKFFLSATKDNRLIADYASDPVWSKACYEGFSPEHQDTSWKDGRSANWGYYYLNRFPYNRISKMIREVSPFIRIGYTGFDPNVGGNPICFLGKHPK